MPRVQGQSKRGRGPGSDKPGRKKGQAVAGLVSSVKMVFRSESCLSVKERNSKPKDVRLEAGRWLELDELDPNLAPLFRS